MRTQTTPGSLQSRSLTHLNQLVEGLVDEDEGDEEGKDLLGETGDKTHQEAPLQGHHEQCQKHQPEANPHTAHKVLQVVAVAELRGRDEIRSSQVQSLGLMGWACSGKRRGTK